MVDKVLCGTIISSLITATGKDTAVVASELQISPQRLGQYKNGTRFPNAEFFQLWKEKFGDDIMDMLSKNKLPRELITIDNSTLEELKAEYASHLVDIKQSTSETIAILKGEILILTAIIEDLKNDKRELFKRM